jgi:hypothetical protein
MLQLTNVTPFAADRALLISKEGDQIWTVVVKATYHFDEHGSVDLHPDQEPVFAAPVYEGEPDASSLLREPELVYEHPGTDVYLLASAHAPEQRPVESLLVRAVVGPVQKTLKVYGERLWLKGLTSIYPSSPQHFVHMPIRYERAYGGTVTASDGTSIAREPRNPIGRGFAKKADSLADTFLPNIEDPQHLIRSWHDHPLPAGFGPIPPMWAPRLQYAGTFDAHWRDHRMPLPPQDFDARYAQAAHPDLVSQEALRGGEEVVLENLTPESLCRFRLPRARLIIRTYAEGSWLLQNSQLDRIIIEPDQRKLAMVWRSTLNCRGYGRKIRASTIELKPWRTAGSQGARVG